MKHVRIGMLLAAFCALWCGPVHADGREFFVGRHGSDDRSGLTPEDAFGTIAHGLARLEPGDTLTIAPGEYHESLEASISGTPDAPITLRAERPGTVWIRGDLDVDGFRRVEHTRYTYVVEVDRPVEGVAERTSLHQYAYVPSPVELDEVRGAFYYDEDNRRLYVRTTDGRHPDEHALSVSVRSGFGLLLRHPRDVIVDGLAFSGYNSRDAAPRPGHRTRWGILLISPERVTIRRCSVFFNGGGIGLIGGTDVLVEECVVFANNSPHHASGGNVITRGAATRVVYRNNISHSTLGRGLRFYTGGGADCRVEGNLTYGINQEDIQFKGGDYSSCHVTGNIVMGGVTLGGAPAAHARHNIVGRRIEGADDSNIFMTGRFNPAEHFADPVNHDYRLQSTSPLRGMGPDGTDPGPFPYRDEVFYVAPDGDDGAEGTALDRAWATLGHAARTAKAGHTVYIRGGLYREALAPAHDGTRGEPIRFRRYAREAVILDGENRLPAGIDLDGRAHIEVEGLAVRNFTQAGLRADRTRHIALRSSRMLAAGNYGIRAQDASDLILDRNFFASNGATGVWLAGCRRVRMTGNAFDGNPAPIMTDAASLEGLWSNRNNFAGLDAERALRIDGESFADLDTWQASTGLDPQSMANPTGRLDPGRDQSGLTRTSRLVGRGPETATIGPWEIERRPAPLEIEDVRIHSVTATTANLEWWTPAANAVTTLEWGHADEPDRVIGEVHSSATFHTVSLIGLDPDTEYVFRVRAQSPAWEFHINEELAREEELRRRQHAVTEPQRFRTASRDEPGRTFHVAPTGDNRSSGLSPDEAWASLRHAAAMVRAGDSVRVAAGIYRELTVIRATGDERRPIRFVAEPGAEVWMEGSDNVRPNAFRIPFKHHVRLEGFRFRHFALNPYGSTASTGAVRIVGGTNVTLHRCFYDGRSALGYTALFVHGTGTVGLLIDNCVTIQGWNGMSFDRCPDLTIRHSVFYNCLIRALSVFNEPDERFTLSHNIIADNIPGKVGNTILSVWHLESLEADHNLYFVRLPADRRNILNAFRIGGELVRRTYTFNAMREAGLEPHGLFGNPGIPATAEMIPNPPQWADVELHRSGATIRPLDFNHFVAAREGPAGAAADGRPIGPDPAVVLPE